MLISKNSYLVLWLNTDADEKSINKRHKELLKILNIDEIPEYENDISFINYKELRNTENVKSAFHELTNQKKKLYQDFFWFQIVTSKDEKLLKELCRWNIIEATEWWSGLYQSTWKFHYLKNYAIALLLSYEQQKKFDDLDFSNDWPEIVKSFYKIIESDKFWKEFVNIINLSAEVPISPSELNTFKSEVPQYLAEEFFDLSEELKSPKLYIEFNKVFWLNAKELDDNENVTKPLSIIENNSKKIKELDLWSDLDEIIDLINETEKEVKKLKKIWLAENPKILKIRDNIASQIRNLWISLYNDYWNSQSSKDFIEEAKIIAWWITLQSKLDEDLEVINSNIELEWKSNKYDNLSSRTAKKYGGYSQSIDSLIPIKELQLTLWEVNMLVSQWGKFIYFPFCWSALVITKKEPWGIYFKPPWASWFWTAITPIVLTLFLWWRGLPRWPIFSLECIFSNLFGWKDITDKIMASLRGQNFSL